MDCEKYIIMMNMLIDGELSSEERKELSKHISGCPGCEKRLRQLKMIKDETKQLTVEPPLQLHDAVMRSIRREEIEKKARIGRKIASLCAAAGIIIVFALVAVPKFSKLYLFGKSAEGGTSAITSEASADGVLSEKDVNAPSGGVSAASYGAAGYTADTQAQSSVTGASGGTAGGASYASVPSTPGENREDVRSDPGAQASDMPGAAVPQSAGTASNATKASSLKASESFSAYYAFYGNYPIPDSFSAEDMKYFPQDNETYLFVKNTDLKKALSEIEAAGFKKTDYVFPEADGEKDRTLIVICGDK